MDIIGTGFIARHFERLRFAHPHVLVFASGVSCSTSVSEGDYRREAELLYGTIHQCRAQQRTLVYFSTGGDLLYEGPGCEGREDDPIFPRSAYGRHKLLMETVVQQSGVDHLILRLTNPVGRNQQPHQLIPALYNQILRGAVLIRRRTRRDLIDIVDVVSVTDRLLIKGVSNQVINLASGFAVFVEDIVNHLVARLSAFVQRSYIDGNDDYRVSNAKLLRLLPEAETFHFGPLYYKRVLDTYYQPVSVTPMIPAVMAGNYVLQP